MVILKNTSPSIFSSLAALSPLSARPDRIFARSLLRSRGIHVLQQKLDPYINVDPGTMNRSSMVRST